MPPQTQNRRDLLQAYRLMTRRTALALIAGEPDSPNQPLRRRNMATVSGVLAGVIACAVFGVIGMLSPGPVSGLTKAGTLVIDKDTATPYVPCQASGEQKLCPALNYASALLALDTTSVNRVDVTQATLANYKIGPAVGIEGLPQDLPVSANLVKGPWSVCMDNNGVSTLVGGASVGGKPLTVGFAELVKSQGQNWVLWNGTRMKISNNIMTVLWSQTTPQAVSSAWLNTLPEAPDFTPPVVHGEGQSVRGPNNTEGTVGQIFTASTPQGNKSYVLDQGGKLDPVTPVQAALLEFAPSAPKQPQSIAPSTAAENVGTPIPSDSLPATLPRIPRFTSPVCVSYGTGMSRTVTTGGTIPANASPTGNGSTTTVDRVWLPQGRGALIGVTASVNQPPVKQWFLLDGAKRYGLSGSAVANILGYDLAKDETVLPASLVDVLPEGKALDPGAANQPASG